MMDIVYFLLLCIVIVVVWRYITKRFFLQGRGKLLTYFVASSMAFCIFSFGIVAIATHDTKESKVLNEVSEERNFKEDQVALISYFNKIIPVKLYVDLQAEEMVIYLQQNDIIKAANSTKKCTETTKTFSKELEIGDYKAIPLKNSEHNKALKTAIEKLAAGYSYRNAQCVAAYRYLDDPKPSTAVEIKEQKTLADNTINLAIDSLKKEIMKNYHIELLNSGEYAIVE